MAGRPVFGQKFPVVSETQRIEMLKPPKKRPARMVLDTDTYNEIDDQFAVVYALISPELNVEAAYAAPFKNNRSKGPRDGMEKSYEEILRILRKLGRSSEGFAFRGSTNYLTNIRNPERSSNAFHYLCAGKGKRLSTAGYPFWRDYSIDVAAMSPGKADVGVVFLRTDESNCYLWRIPVASGRTMKLAKIVRPGRK